MRVVTSANALVLAASSGAGMPARRSSLSCLAVSGLRPSMMESNFMEPLMADVRWLIVFSEAADAMASVSGVMFVALSHSACDCSTQRFLRSLSALLM